MSNIYNVLKKELQELDRINDFRSGLQSGDRCHLMVNGVLIDIEVDVRVGNCIYPIVLDQNIILTRKRFYITEIYE